MKVLVSLREEWKEKFDPDYGPKEFEMEHEEEERFRASQRYAADTISGMLNEDARRDSARASKGKNKMDEPSGSGGGYASSSTRPDGEGDPAWSKWRVLGGTDLLNGLAPAFGLGMWTQSTSGYERKCSAFKWVFADCRRFLFDSTEMALGKEDTNKQC